jgi:cell division protein FtsB
MTDPQSRITQLEREVRRWRRAALILTGTVLLFVLGFGVMATRLYVLAALQERIALEMRQAAEEARAKADAQLRFLGRDQAERVRDSGRR